VRAWTTKFQLHSTGTTCSTYASCTQTLPLIVSIWLHTLSATGWCASPAMCTRSGLDNAALQQPEALLCAFCSVHRPLNRCMSKHLASSVIFPVGSVSTRPCLIVCCNVAMIWHGMGFGLTLMWRRWLVGSRTWQLWVMSRQHCCLPTPTPASTPNSNSPAVQVEQQKLQQCRR
jgi:hypothetical protein